MKAFRKPRSLVLVGCVICLGLVSSACSRSSVSTDSDGPFELEIQEGAARINDGTKTRKISATSEISPGDKIQLDEDARAILRVTGGSTVELDGAAVGVESASRLALERGRILVDARGPFTVANDRLLTSTRGPGLFRIDKDLATRVGVYRGEAVRAGRAGEAVPVPAFHQIVVAGGVVPRAAKPLKFSSKDRWDGRFLSEAIDLDSRLTDIARGLEAQLGEGGGLEFFQRSAGSGEVVDFLGPFLANRRSDLLIGLLMAFEANRGVPSEFSERFTQVFSFWSEGATWGLVARTFDVKGDDLFARLRDAIDRAKINVIGPGPGLQQSPQAPRGTSPTPRPSGTIPGPQATPGASPAPTSSPSGGVLLPQVAVQLPSQLTNIINGLLGVSR